jgi:hypothetical protein
MQSNRTYGGRSAWMAFQDCQVPEIGLGIEVNRIHRRRGGRRVAIGQSSNRKHVCVGGDRPRVLWLLHDKICSRGGGFRMFCRSWIRSGQTAIRIPSKFPQSQLAHHLLQPSSSGFVRLPTLPSPSTSRLQTTFFTTPTLLSTLSRHREQTALPAAQPVF